MKQHRTNFSPLDVQILAASLGDELRDWKPNVHAAYEDAKLALALRLVRELGDNAPWPLEAALQNPVVLKLLEAGRAAVRELHPLKQKIDGLATEVKVLRGKLAQRTAPRQVKKGAKPKAPAPRPSSTRTRGGPAGVAQDPDRIRELAAKAAAGKAPGAPVLVTVERRVSAAASDSAGGAGSGDQAR